jgi:hypothetical protein
MHANPFYAEGYYAGLVNDRECPHSIWSLAWPLWQLGNDAGVRVHCATVEAVYLATMENCGG